jgi:hypothetical protein
MFTQPVLYNGLLRFRSLLNGKRGYYGFGMWSKERSALTRDIRTIYTEAEMCIVAAKGF